MFSIPSNEENQIMKRPIAKHYSPGAVLALEPLLDGVMGQLCDELDQRFVKTPTGSKPCDLGAWIAYCKSVCSLYTPVFVTAPWYLCTHRICQAFGT